MTKRIGDWWKDSKGRWCNGICTLTYHLCDDGEWRWVCKVAKKVVGEAESLEEAKKISEVFVLARSES